VTSTSSKLFTSTATSAQRRVCSAFSRPPISASVGELDEERRGLMVALMLLGSLVAQQSGTGKNRALVSRLREGYVEGGIIDMGRPFSADIEAS